MGFGGISVWQLLIILAIVALIFGTKRIRQAGGDLGGAIRGFREGVQEIEQLEKDEHERAREAREQKTGL